MLLDRDRSFLFVCRPRKGEHAGFIGLEAPQQLRRMRHSLQLLQLQQIRREIRNVERVLTAVARIDSSIVRRA